MKKALLVLFILILVLVARPAAAQETDGSLQLSLQKEFGFAMGGRIQGKFTIKALGPDDLVRVEFWIDEQIVCVDEEPPFGCPFSTGDYELDLHRITAVGRTVQGEALHAEVLKFEFISADEGWRSALGFIGPIVIGLVVLMLLASLGPILLEARKQPAVVVVYGAAGGAVCPRCSLPYARHSLSLHLGSRKVERCPHCGKWALVHRATSAELAEAEVRLAADSERGELEIVDEENHLRRLIDESRYER